MSDLAPATKPHPVDDLEHGEELWTSDGTPHGTRLVRDIHLDGDASPSALTTLGLQLIFTATTTDSVVELWASDGTEAGTVQLTDLHSVNPQLVPLASANGVLLFRASTFGHGPELWRTDGTRQGTFIIELVPDRFGSFPNSAVALKELIYFRAFTDEHGRELWRSDGTARGTEPLIDLYPGWIGAIDQGQGPYAAAGGLIFTADDGNTGSSLWRSDGTAAGTWRVVGLPPTAGQLTEAGKLIFFTVSTVVSESGSQRERPPRRAIELWRTDGSEAGTFRVREPSFGSNGRMQYPLLAAIGDTLFFTFAFDRQNFWISDGTEEGTQPAGADPFPVFVEGLFLYSGGPDREVYTSKPGHFVETAQLLADVAPGDAISGAGPFVVAGEKIYFAADDNRTGRELWALPRSALRRCVADCDGDGRVTVAEIVSSVRIALGSATLDLCPAADPTSNSHVTIDELALAVRAAAFGCNSEI